jgi:hypothetical protein
MIVRKLDAQLWREYAMARTGSSSESRSGPATAPVVELQEAPIESSAWDPYEVWLTRVKQPRDARDQR